MDKIYSLLEATTIKILTKRKQKRAYEKSKKKTIFSELYSWVDALVFAVVVVIIINQFLFQLFVIPSPSMVDTLNVQDRVVVSKVSYGIELYPAGKKIFTNERRVERDNIITFYNPLYESKGPLFDILSQAIYMGTLSLVNIDKNPDGSIRERLYVKRAALVSGETGRFKDGDLYIKPVGYNTFISERSFREDNNLILSPKRTVDKSQYDSLHAWARLYSYQESDLNSAPEYLISSYKKLKDSSIFDYYEFESQRLKGARLINPTDLTLRSQEAKYALGIYVPKDYILPLGDNRDNSQDGRYFGPVKEESINGRVVGRFFPLNRISIMTDK